MKKRVKRMFSGLLAFCISVSSLAAVSVPAMADIPAGTSKAWDYFPSTEGLADTSAVYSYTPAGDWTFEQAPVNTTNFTLLDDLYYIARGGYQCWSVSAGVAQGGDVQWGNSNVLQDGRIFLSGGTPAMVYTAPSDGTVEFGAEAPVYADYWEGEGLDGVNIAVYKSNAYGAIIPIWPTGQRWQLLGGSADAIGTEGNPYTFAPVRVSIKAGEKLYFVSDFNQNGGNDVIHWKPTVTYINGTYDAADDPALAMPEAAVMADVVPYDGAADNTFEHGNGWRMDMANGNTYTAMNQLGWNGAWNQARFYKYDGDIELEDGTNFTVHWEQGVIMASCWADVAWHTDGLFMYPAENGNDVAFTYQAPRDGVLDLDLTDAGIWADNDDTKLGLAVYKNDVQIWPESGVYSAARDAGSSDEKALGLEKITTAVRAGDELHVRASQVSIAGDYSLRVLPSAQYTSLVYDETLDKEYQFNSVAEYSFHKQFSDTQGKNGWYYLYAPIGEDDTTQLPQLVDGWAWCAGVEEYNIAQVYDSEVLPGNMYDAIVAFKAPYTGKIRISMEDGIWLQSSSGEDAGDGCRFGVQLSSDGEISTLLPMTDIANGGGLDFQTIDLDVKKNEYLYFRVNRGESNNWHDVLHMTPAVKYSSIDFDDPGIIEEVDPSGRNNPAAGSRQEAGRFPLVGREYTGAQEFSLTAAEMAGKIQSGDLVAGAVYNITDHLTIGLYSIGADTVYDLKNIAIRTSPSGDRWDGVNPDDDGGFAFALENCTGAVTLKNFTLEVGAMDASHVCEDIFNTWVCGNVTLQNAEIIAKDAVHRAVHLAGGTAGAEFVLDGCRVTGAFAGGAVVLEAGGSCGATVVESCILNSAGAAVRDLGSTGALLLDNTLSAPETAVELGCGNAVVQNNTVSGAIRAGSGLENLLIALNQAETVSLPGAVNSVLLMNHAADLSISGGVNITVAENTVSGELATADADYLLLQGNTAARRTDSGSTNVFGDDVNDPDARAANGVNEELLPKTNFEPFVGMTPKTTVRTADGETALKRYLNAASRKDTYVVIPPGLYSSSAISLAGIDGYDVYAYGVMIEFEKYSGNVFTMNNCTDVSVYGLTISHAENANGQATIIEKNDTYVIAQTDPGYLPDLTDSDKYPDSLYVEAFRPGETTPFADIGFGSIEYLGDGKHKCVLSNDRSRELEVGGKITVRGNGASVVVLTGSGGIRFEDVSIISGAGFGFQERNGDGGTVLYRVAITPKAAPLLSGGTEDYADRYEGLVWTDAKGRLRGPAPLLSTCDATHSTNMRVGPQVINCLFEQMSDDGTNISGEFGKVTGYDAATRTLTYAKGDNYYEGLPADFRDGDHALLFTRSGEFIAEAVVAGAPASAGYQTYALTLDRDVEIKSGTLIENASANGAGFLFDNCLVDTTRSRGFLIKASDGKIKNCTIRNVGMAAILVKPEIDAGWNECGYVQNLEITDNLFENTGFYNDTLISSPIAVSGDGMSTADPAFLMHSNILIQNNVVRSRNTTYAAYLNGVRQVKLLNNDFGVRSGMELSQDTGASVRIDGAYDVEISGNRYPQNAENRIELSAQTQKIFGTDIEIPPIGDYASVTADSVYTTEGWQVAVTIKNVSGTKNTYELSFADSTTAGLLTDGAAALQATVAAGESRTLYFPVQTLPSDMTPKRSAAQVDVSVAANGSQGVFSSQITFNGAIRVPSAGQIDWSGVPGIGKEGDDRGEKLSADARFAWDENNLYMRVEVIDDVQHDCENPDELWDWDSLQIGFAPDRGDVSGYFVYTIGRINGQVSIHMDNDTIGGKAGTWLTLSDMPSSIVRDEDAQTTTYLMAIPWEMFGIASPADRTIGFDIVVNDRDGSIGDEGEPEQWNRWYLEYYGGIAAGRYPARFGGVTMLNEVLEVPAADTAVLEQALESAKGLELSQYTDATAGALRSAIAAAEELLGKKLTTNDQDAVDAAAETIRQAISALEEKQGAGGSEEPGKPENPPQQENPATGGAMTAWPAAAAAFLLAACAFAFTLNRKGRRDHPSR